MLVLCGFSVHDGDTITKISYRLAYIDAPELRQTCHVKGMPLPIGELSQQFLKRVSKNGLRQCHIIKFDRYNRAIVDCGYNLSIVKYGMAVCLDRYMDKEERELCWKEQEYAKTRKLGLWQCDDFIVPSEFRKMKRQ